MRVRGVYVGVRARTYVRASESLTSWSVEKARFPYRVQAAMIAKKDNNNYDFSWCAIIVCMRAGRGIYI